MAFLYRRLSCLQPSIKAALHPRCQQQRTPRHRNTSTFPSSQGLPEPYLDSYSNLDESLKCWGLKEDTAWGFVVYRTSYQANSQWQRMIQHINEEIHESLSLNQRLDLLKHHRLTVIDDAAKFDGATSHAVRDHFQSWVSSELTTVLKDPSKTRCPVNLGERAVEVELSLGSRYNFCLFVDDICLESLDKMSYPVVKLLSRATGIREPEDREYQVDPYYEDGDTEFTEEDVGWMYIEVLEYCSKYNGLVDPHVWLDQYWRPPYMLFSNDEEFPGNWRASDPNSVQYRIAEEIKRVKLGVK
ncbi:hypothetical protein BJY01DRAFT_207522 [Aspergillus pseudoustus]|uniref:Uncharacterized protein n=1 Tax=Aspergillus pseudoustus TaxID=1810923 RepID=A0ABR4KKY5_9EURO